MSWSWVVIVGGSFLVLVACYTLPTRERVRVSDGVRGSVWDMSNTFPVKKKVGESVVSPSLAFCEAGQKIARAFSPFFTMRPAFFHCWKPPTIETLLLWK